MDLRCLRCSGYRFRNFRQTPDYGEQGQNNPGGIKEEIHELIDSIEDESMLSVLHQNSMPYVIENRTKEADDIDDNFTEKQLKDLDESIAEATEEKRFYD